MAEVPLSQNIGVTVVGTGSATVIILQLSTVLNLNQEPCAAGFSEPSWDRSRVMAARVIAVVQNTEPVCRVQAVVRITRATCTQ